MYRNGDGLEERMILAAFRVANLLYREGNRLAGRFGLTQQQWVLLAAIARGGRAGVPLSRLGENLLVTKSNITGMIVRMARDGYVTRTNDPADRRVFRARLTPKGEAFLKGIAPLQRRWESGRLAGFTAAEKRSYLELSRKYVESIRKGEA